MKHALIAMCLSATIGVQAQNVGIGTSSPNVNAKLDITATDKGVLIPRMDSVHRKTIPNTIGLLVYDSTTQSFWVNNGKAWQNMAESASGWSLTGNAGLDTSINFLGTTDNTPLIFKVSNQFSGALSANLSFGIHSYNGTGMNENNEITAIGTGALQNNAYTGNFYTSGIYNTALGSLALNQNTTGQSNTAVGNESIRNNTTGVNNTGVGSGALLRNTTGSGNTGLGSGSLYYSSTGNNNTAVGISALIFNNTGNSNTAVGSLALQNAAGVSGNTSVGANALRYNFNGSNNTALGYNADFPGPASPSSQFSNTTVIGANAVVDASNKIRLGDANVTVVESNGVFNTVSDGRFKYNIHEDVKGLDFILKLRPVTYQFDPKKQEDFIQGNLSTEQLNSPVIPADFNESNSIKRTGFIAQEVAAAAKRTGYDFDGVKIPATDKQYYSLSYASFVVPLVKAMQEQQMVIEDLKKQNELLQQKNEIMQAQNQAIIKRLEVLENKK